MGEGQLTINELVKKADNKEKLKVTGMKRTKPKESGSSKEESVRNAGDKGEAKDGDSSSNEEILSDLRRLKYAGDQGSSEC